ncbi:hypothetical protein [Alkalihalobacterium bogoriense]|uniref:hypothetical protein n=1 Tax=Alkalihalobacterium bogoriense TaxID=246272 RepID=UPI0012EBFC83|nr:hypothetical protein [Alkalihalobacterium bogoriense]
MIDIFIMIKSKEIIAIPFFSFLFAKLTTASATEVMEATIIKTIIKKPTRSVVAVAIGSKKTIEREASKLKIKRVKLLQEYLLYNLGSSFLLLSILT